MSLLLRFFAVSFTLLIQSCGAEANDNTAPAMVPIHFQSSLEFRLAFSSGEKCKACAIYPYTSSVGTRREVFAPIEANMIVAHDGVAQVDAWRGPGESGHMNIALGRTATESLEQLAAEAAKQDARVLVSLGDLVVDVIERRVLVASHGVLALSFWDEQLFAGALVAAGINDRSLAQVTEEELLSDCLRVAGDDAERRKRCADENWSKLMEQRAAVRRAEEALESEHPDYDAVLRDLGVPEQPASNR